MIGFSLAADNYRHTKSPDACCAECDHLLNNGPRRRLCKIHTYGYGIMHSVTLCGVCDKFRHLNSLYCIVRDIRAVAKRSGGNSGDGLWLNIVADRIEHSPDNPERK